MSIPNNNILLFGIDIEKTPFLPFIMAFTAISAVDKRKKFYYNIWYKDSGEHTSVRAKTLKKEKIVY